MTAHTLEWILYAVSAALLLGFLPSFMKAGVQKVAPSAAAAVFSVVMLAFAIGNAVISGTLDQILEMDNMALLWTLGAGVVRGLLWLSIFAALSTGGVQRVVPITRLNSACMALLGILLYQASHGIWKLCCIVLVLLGVVLMESRTQRGRGYRWLLFACVALAADLGGTWYHAHYLKGVTSSVAWVVEAAVAGIALWGLTIAGKSTKTLKKLKVENWIYLVLSGAAAGLALLCDGKVHAMGDASFLYPVAGLVLPFAMLGARLFHKEKLPGSAVFGMLLTMGGAFGLLLGL